ncbi:MAG: hypothetical protein JNG89_06735 [Planctomycetaceae bacterium]|nr:hypothetical protein [Planctomycetaceae bacterium]
MYRCQLCQTVVPAKQRSTKIVLKTRPRTYNQRGEIAREFRGRFPRRGMPRKQPEYDKGGVGSEIVQEAMVCPKCAEKFAAEQQAAAAAVVTSEVSM